MGGRGYTQKCLATDALRDRHTISETCFADDVTAVAMPMSNLKVQCYKVQEFSTLTGLPLNYTKC